MFNVVNILKEYSQVVDLQSSSSLHITVGELTQKYVVPPFDENGEHWPDLVRHGKMLEKMAFLLEGLHPLQQENTEETQSKKNSTISSFNTSSNVKEAKQMQSDHYPQADGTN